MSGLPRYSTLQDVARLSVPNVKQLFLEGSSGLQQVWAGDLSFGQYYRQTNPLGTGLMASLILGVYTLILAEITGNYSQVDRLWSLLPTAYICHYAYYARATGIAHDRIDTIALVSIIWSLRLTFNYWRKGGYSWGSEDYRWPILRKNLGRPLSVLLDATFISFMQNWLLFIVTMPAYLFLILEKNFPSEGKQSKTDMFFSRGMILAIILEFAADQQQWNFHGAKDEYKQSGKVLPGYDKAELDRGFLSSGLFAFSRHPNFLGEQTVWVLLYQWSAIATDSLYNWTAIAPLFYCILFRASTWFTESLTAGKYKDYSTYQKHVNMFLPGIGTISEGGFDFPLEETKKTE